MWWISAHRSKCEVIQSKCRCLRAESSRHYAATPHYVTLHGADQVGTCQGVAWINTARLSLSAAGGREPSRAAALAFLEKDRAPLAAPGVYNEESKTSEIAGLLTLAQSKKNKWQPAEASGGRQPLLDSAEGEDFLQNLPFFEIQNNWRSVSEQRQKRPRSPGPHSSPAEGQWWG